MVWLISAKKEIVRSEDELLARKNYIRNIMNAGITEWKKVSLLPGSVNYYVCLTNDIYNGICITGHVSEVYELAKNGRLKCADFVIANTCVWDDLNDKKILYALMKHNTNAKLWFAKQKMTLEYNHIIRKTNAISDVGKFGFPTSRSERILYVSRKSGFEKAVEQAYDLVSPVILSKDYIT